MTEVDNDNKYRWVRLSEHCRQTGDTANAVHARRRKRIWQDGVQCRVGPDGNLYINPAEYNKWVESSHADRKAPANIPGSMGRPG